MSDRMEFWEIRQEKGDNGAYAQVCLCTTEEKAKALSELLQTLQQDKKYFVEHVEVVATTDLDLRDY